MLLALWQPAQGHQTTFLLMMRNATAQALECQLLAAHWYSWPAVRVAPRGSVTFRLLRGADGAVIEPASGLPVERLFCGPAGRAWQNQADIDLRRLAAEAVCRDQSAGLVCN